MAKLDFPAPATLNEVWTDPNNQTWVYNGDAWVRTKVGSGIPEPTEIGVQMARQVDEAGKPGKWAKVAQDIWYLGAYTSPPAVDNDDVPLDGRPGFVYYNANSEKMFSWDGEVWNPFAPTYEIFGLTTYTYVITAVLLGSPLTGPDIYGNTPSGWQSKQTLVNVFRTAIGGTDPDTGGNKLLPQLDPAVSAEDADFSIDYSLSQVTPLKQWEAGDTINIQISQIQLGQDASTFPWVTNDPIAETPADETKVPTQAIVKNYVIEYVDATSSYNTIDIRTEFVNINSLRVLPGKIIAHNSGNIINFNTAMVKTNYAGGWQEGDYGRGYNSITPTKGRRMDGVFIIQDPIRDKQDVCISESWNCVDRAPEYTDYQLVGVISHGEGNGGMSSFHHVADTIYFHDAFLYWGAVGKSPLSMGVYSFNDALSDGSAGANFNIPNVCTILTQSEFRADIHALGTSIDLHYLYWSPGDTRTISTGGLSGGILQLENNTTGDIMDINQIELPVSDAKVTWNIQGAVGQSGNTFTPYLRINGIKLNPYMISEPAAV